MKWLIVVVALFVVVPLGFLLAGPIGAGLGVLALIVVAALTQPRAADRQDGGVS